MRSRVRGNKKGRFGEDQVGVVQVEVGGGRRVGRGRALQGRVWRRGVERGPGAYGRGQGYGRGRRGTGRRTAWGTGRRTAWMGRWPCTPYPPSGTTTISMDTKIPAKEQKCKKKKIVVDVL